MNYVILFLVIGVVTTLPQHLNTLTRANSWVSKQPSWSSIPFWTYQHHKMRPLSHLNDGFWWLALIEVVNKKEKDFTCKFLHPHGPCRQFHRTRGDDSGYVPSNKVIIKIQTPTTSANGRPYFIIEEEKSKAQNSFERASVLDGGILFFVLDRLLTCIDFDVYFTMQLIKTSKFSWHLWVFCWW